MDGKIYICKNCMEDKIVRDLHNIVTTRYGKQVSLVHGAIRRGFVDFDGYEVAFNTTCPICNGEIQEIALTKDEFDFLRLNVTIDPEFMLAMNDLKKNDIIEFRMKISQIKATKEKEKQESSNIPKCPTCKSTKVRKISGTKRWLGTGLFGLASSDIGKTMQCDNCGYKW